MKKLFLSTILFVFLIFPCFCNGDEKEEIDYLLFMPNSADQFVNSRQAATQLDNLADYLRTRNLTPGQINVYGYAADRVNDIDPFELSKERALFVINELHKRGISGDMFSEPMAYGAVNLWGSNTDEAGRIPNRRVRILLDGSYLTPETIKTAETVQPAPSVPTEEKIIPYKNAPDKSGFRFPWLLLLLLLLALIGLLFFLVSRSRKRPADKKAEAASPPPVIAPKPAPAVIPVVAPAAAIEEVVNLDEEIRYCAYMLSLKHNDYNRDMDGDWHKAVCEISARYKALGYKVYFAEGYWWARISR